MAAGGSSGSGWSQASHKHGWVASNYERYERFKNNLLHGEDWSQGLKFFAMYWITFRKDDGTENTLHSPMFENADPSPGRNESSHAEECMLKHLNLLLSGFDLRRIVMIIIMQDASPCKRCSDRYIRDLSWLLHPRWRIGITIVFSSFFKICRPFCLDEGHSHIAWIDPSYSDINLAALKRLRTARFFLKTTDYEDWEYLREALQLHPITREIYDLSARKREDDLLREDQFRLGLHCRV